MICETLEYERETFASKAIGPEAEVNTIEQLIVQQDARIIVALRKGEDIPLEAENEALRLRCLLNDVRTRNREFVDTRAYKRASGAPTSVKQDIEKSRARRENGGC
jgi:hypothetical protein